MNVPCPEIQFTSSTQGRARSFYRSGYAINRATGETVKVREPLIVMGISGKRPHASPENYAVLAHEMGHHKTVVDLERKQGQIAVSNHYALIQKSDAARVESEREAWKHADPYLKENRGAQKWLKKFAFGTYLGTTPGYPGYRSPELHHSD